MKAIRLESARDVVKALGGTMAVAVLTGATPKRVSAWQKGHESFPPRTYVAMMDALGANGLTAPPSLWRMLRPSSAEHLPSRATAENY